MKRLCYRVLVAVLILSMMPLGAMGQQRTAMVVGVVRSTQGNPVAGVKISARDPSRGFNSEAVTDVLGRYALQQLTPGRYQLALDPVRSPYRGQTVVSAIGAEGLTVNWVVSEGSDALAAATPGTQSGGVGPAPTDPNQGGLFGLGPHASGALVYLGTAGLIAGILCGTRVICARHALSDHQ